MLRLPERWWMRVPGSPWGLDRRDLQVEHLMEDDRDEYIVGHICRIEDVVDANATRRRGDTSERPLENKAPRDVVEGALEELRRNLLYDGVEIPVGQQGLRSIGLPTKRPAPYFVHALRHRHLLRFIKLRTTFYNSGDGTNGAA